MFLGLQDFDFAQILSNLPKYQSLVPKFCFKFAQISPKSNQICP